MDNRLTFSGRFNYWYEGGVTGHLHPDDYQIQLVYGGSANVRIDDRTIHAEKGDILLVKQGSFHEFKVDCKSGMKTLEVKFQTKDPHFIELVDKIQSPLKDEDDKIFQIFSQIIIEGYRQVFPYKTLTNALLVESIALLARLSENKTLSSLDAPSLAFENKSSHSQLVQDATEFISLNMDRNLGIREIAEGCGYSGDYFYRVIKRETGMTAIQFVNALRFKQAKRLIQHSELSLSEIAWNLGFSNLQYFSRFFRQHAGVSPSEYMAKVRSLIRTDY